MSLSLIQVILSVIICLLTFVIFVKPFLKKVIRRFQINQKIKKLPGPPSHWFFGNLGLFKSKTEESSYVIEKVLTQLSNDFRKERIFRLRFGFKYEVYLSTPETIEAVLSKNTLIDKSDDYEILKKWLGQSLLTSSGSKWRNRRKILTPTFHFKILEDFIPLINEHATILCGRLQQKRDDEDIISYLTSCTLDIIMETAMGVKLNAQIQKDVPYVTALHRFGEIFAKRSLTPWMWIDFLFNRSTLGREFYQKIAILHEFTTSVIKKRKQEIMDRKANNNSAHPGDDSKKRLALLDLLLEYHLTDNSLDEEDIRSEVDTFTFGGHDTTGIALTYTLFLIGHHPDVQEKIHQELKDVFADDTNRIVTKDDLNRLQYLECVIKESLRIYPSAPLVSRTLADDVTIAGYDVPKGTDVVIMFRALHLNPEEFPDPEKFDPDRFKVENSCSRHPFAYCPFSAGPRSCIGQKFAMIEEKIILTYILRRFLIKTLTPFDQLKISMEIVLRPKPPVRIQFTQR